MKIETIVTTLQAAKNDTKAEPILRRLMDRLEGLLNDASHAEKAAEALGVSWSDLGSPKSPRLAWARLTRELHEHGRIADLVPVVVPLLPEGQAYTEHEIFNIDTEIATETFGGTRAGLAAARARKAEMIGWNAVHAKGPLHVTPDPLRQLGSSEDPPRRSRSRTR